MKRQSLALTAALILGGLPGMACTGVGKTAVEEIYPSGLVVPENMLRFYLYFSAPMGDADVLPHLSLERSDGAVIDGAFLSSRFDLWSPDRTRLTLLFDPGRVKTGLEAHDALGRALTAGQSYRLTLDAGMTDSEGCPLAGIFSHSFAAGPADFQPPDPAGWQIDMPAAGSADPVNVRLGSTHDHLSMAYRIRVENAAGTVVPGRIELAEAEATWTFHPREPWAGADYVLSVDDQLEDLAGNRPGQLFDQPIDTSSARPTLRRPLRLIAR